MVWTNVGGRCLKTWGGTGEVRRTTMSFESNPVCEPLEDRRLLAAHPLIMIPVGGVYGVTVGVNASTAPGTTQDGRSNSATVTTTSLLGTWEGKVKVNLFLFV